MISVQHHTTSISFPLRLILYVAGGIILAFGITLNTKTLLGVSPIISVPYAISVIGDFPLGVVTFIFYAFCIFMQFALLQKQFEKIRICQIFMSFVTSLFIQVFDHLLPVPGSALSASSDPHRCHRPDGHRSCDNSGHADLPESS